MAKAFNLTAQINLQGPANIKPVVAQIRRELGSINTNLDIKFSTKAAKGVDSLSQKMQGLNKIFIETNKNSQVLTATLNNLGTSIQNLGNIGKVSNSINKTVKGVTSVSKASRQAATAMEEFGKQSQLAIKRFAAFSFVTTGVFALVNAVRTGTKAFVDFDKQLIRLQQVTGAGAVGIKELQNEITSLAINLGVSSESLTEVAVTLVQAGLSARETQQALAALAKTELAPSFDNLTDTTEGAIAAMRQFGISTADLEKALGSINAVAAAFAVESSDIIVAIQRAGGAFAASSKGVSEGIDALNEFISVFTSVRATTRESAETIATGLRTIFTRIQRGSTIDFLREFGVELTDIEGKFVGPFEAVKRLSSVLNTLDPRDLRFSQIVEELGGFRQIGKVIPLIQQFSEAQKALGVAQRGQGSLDDARAKGLLSLANQLARVREEFLALIREIGQSQTFQGLFKLVLGLTSGLIKLAGVFKPILPLLTILGTIQAGKALTGFTKGFFGGGGKGGGGGGISGILGGGGSGGGGSSAASESSATSNATALIENTKSVVANTASLDALTTAVRARSSGSTFGSGGEVKQFARGGFVPGSGNRDTVPAMLTPGEFVIRKKAVETIGANNLHQMNKYNSGGLVQKFLRGGTVEETAQLEGISISDAILRWVKELGGIKGVKKLSGRSGGDRSLDSILRANSVTSNLDQATKAINKALSNQVGSKVREAQAINKALKLGVVGMEPLGFRADKELKIKGIGKTALLIRGLPDDPRYADAVSGLRTGLDQLSSKLATDFQSAAAFKGSGPVALDFDETLVSGADLFTSDGRIDIQGYDDLTRVKEALKKGQPTALAEKIKQILDFDKSFINRIRVLTARPQENAPLLADKLNSIGIPIPASKIQGTRGGGAAKADKLGLVERLIDDNLANINAAKAQGKDAKQYKELRKLSDKETRAKGIANAEGAALELALSKLGAEGGTIKEAAVDFRNGLGQQASQIFGLPPDIPTEVKRTLSSAAIKRAENEFKRFFEENTGPFPIGSDVYAFDKFSGLPVDRYAKGGKVPDYYSLEKSSGFGTKEFDSLVQFAKTNDFSIEEFKDYLSKRKQQKGSNSNLMMNTSQLRDVLLSGTRTQQASQKQLDLARQLMPEYASGGSVQDTVPALLTPGEFVINKNAAKKIGYGKLNKLNKADKLQGYNKGGAVGFVQKLASGGITETSDFAAAVRAFTEALQSGGKATEAFEAAIERARGLPDASGKTFENPAVVKAFEQAAKSYRDAGGGKDAFRAAISDILPKGSKASDAFGSTTRTIPSLTALAESAERSARVMDLFAAQAEESGVSLQKYQQSLKSQLLDKASGITERRKTDRSSLRQDILRGRITDLSNTENKQELKDNLTSKLASLVDPDIDATKLESAVESIIQGLEVGKTLEELKGTVDVLDDALNSATDSGRSLAEAEAEMVDALGGLTDAARATKDELEAFEYKKSGQAQADFGMLGQLNPGGALAFKRNRSGGRLLGTAQNFMETGGLGKLPLIGKGITGLGKALENLPGPIGSAIKAVGGLPGAFAAVTSIIGSEVIPKLLNGMNMGTSEVGAGIGGALAEGGSRAASMAALGNQIAGPIGAAVGLLTGAISGAIQGFSDAFRTKQLENSLARLNSSIENVDKAFENLAKKDNIQNVIEAQKSLIAPGKVFDDLKAQSEVTAQERAASGASTGVMGLGAGLIIGTAALLAGIPTGGLGTAGVLATAGAVGFTGGAMYGEMSRGPDELDNEALQASIKVANKYIDGLNQLAERDIKLKNLQDLETTVGVIDQINKDLADNKITSTEAEALKKAEFINIGAKGASVENAQRAALMGAGIDIRPDKPVAEQIAGNEEATQIAKTAAEEAAYRAGMAKLGRLYGENNAMIREESKDRAKVIAMGQEELGMREYQMAATERITRLTKDMAIETENLAAAYTRTLAAIGRFKDELENSVMKINESASMFVGEGGMGRADRTQEQMLRNMAAYSAAELEPVLQNVEGLAGGGQDATKLTDSIRASKIMQERLPEILRTAGARDVGEVTRELDAQLAGAGIGDAVRRTLVKEVEDYLGRETQNRSGESFQEILSNFPALADAIDTAKKAQEVGVAILEAQNDALDAVNQQLDQYNKYLRQSLQWSIKADQIRLQGAIELDKALGRDISLERLNAPFETEIKALTRDIMGGVGTTDPVAIANGIRANQARDEELRGAPGQEGLIRQALNKGTKEGNEEAKKLLQEQADLARSSQDAYEALEKLATSGDNAANILGKIEEERQQGRNVIDFVRKVSTQSSEDAIRMNRSFKAFDAAVNGNLNFGNRENRQLAYEGMDTLLPLLKGSETGNKILQRMTENMLQGQGVDIDQKNWGGSGKSLRELIAAGTTGMDPGTQKLVELYKQSITVQEMAARELANLNGAAAQKHLAATEHILTQLYNNLPTIIALALAKPAEAARGEVKPPALASAPAPIASTSAASVSSAVPNGTTSNPVAVSVVGGQNNTARHNGPTPPSLLAAARGELPTTSNPTGAPINGQNINGPVSSQIFDALSLSINNLDLRMLNSITSIDLLQNGIIKLTTSVDTLSNKFDDQNDTNASMTIFERASTFFGGKVDIFKTSTDSFGKYIDKLSEAVGQLGNAKITMGGNYTVDVRVSGAAAFQAIEESTQKLIDKEIGLAMNDLVSRIKKATGMNLDLDRRAP